MEIDVVGTSNPDLWANKLRSEPVGEYNLIFDLSNRTDVFDRPILTNESVVVFGAQKKITTDFSNLLWKACTMVFPSPRYIGFYRSMKKARDLVEQGLVNVDKFWTQIVFKSPLIRKIRFCVSFYRNIR